MPLRKRLQTEEVLNALFHDSSFETDSEYDSSDSSDAETSSDSENNVNLPHPHARQLQNGMGGPECYHVNNQQNIQRGNVGDTNEQYF